MSHQFPVSDHCDGARFFNPQGPSARSFGDLPKWWLQQLRGTSTPWPKSVPVPPKPSLPENVPAGRVAATPALRLGELPRLDVVLLSHNHYDHLDLSCLRWLTHHRRPLIIVPLGLKAWLEERGIANVVELDWWQSHFTGTGIEVVCTPAQHWSSRWPWDRCLTLWGGFWIKADTGSVCFAGDSGWGPHFAEIRTRLGAPDLAMLPIGAYEPRWFMEAVHMNPDEAVRAHLALGARLSLAMHHGTFRLTDEGMDSPLRDLAAARENHGVTAATFAAPAFGETSAVPLG